MNKLAVILALCGSVAIEPPKPEPWEKYSLVGYVRSEEAFQLFGVGNKRLSIQTPAEFGSSFYPLAFASQADYEQAEKEVGQLVEIECYEVTRGVERVYVPVVLRGKR